MRQVMRAGLWCALCCVMGATLLSSAVEARGESRQYVTGTMVGIGGRFAGRTRDFRLIVESYTAPNQIRELNDALRDKGQDGLLRALSGMNAGRIQLGSGIGVTANAIISDPWGDGGTKLTVFYQRNISIYELRYGSRSENYPIGYAEIFLDRNGKGEGTLIAAARVRLQGDNTWEVEDFGSFPARLMGLRSSGKVQPR